MTAAHDWRPGAGRGALQARARLLADIRTFFARRGVLEVETPALSTAGTPDPSIGGFEVEIPGEGRRHLQTSPEFAMKRLLAAGSGDIFQICRAYRAGEAGRFHNPEFTLLEWYRTGFDHHRLMDETAQLIGSVVDGGVGEGLRHTYRHAFREYADIDPFLATSADMAACAARRGIPAPAGMDRGQWLDLLFSQVVASAFPRDRLTIVHDFPPEQAALARIRQGDPPVAERFEVFLGPLELANGFHELTDAAEQQARFEADARRRRRQGLRQVPWDGRLVAALHHGLPRCAGVALGIDRLLMLCLGASHIREVLAFAWDRA